MDKTGDHTNSSWFANALDSSMDSDTGDSSSNDGNNEDSSASEDD